MPSDELAWMVMLYPVRSFVSTATDVAPVAVPPVMPPREGDMTTFDAGVAKAISALTVCETVNWLVAVAPRLTVGSMAMNPMATISVPIMLWHNSVTICLIIVIF